MGRPINSFNWGGGFNITAQEPIDSRLVVATQADLTNASVWEGVGLYNGLVVAVQATGQLFVLKNRDAFTEAASWVAVGGDVSAELSGLTTRVDTLEGTVADLEGVGYALGTKAVVTDAVTHETVYAQTYALFKTVTVSDGTTSAVQVGVDINIPKDLAVTKGVVVTDEETGETNIVLTMAYGEDIVIPASSLVEYITINPDSVNYLSLNSDHQLSIDVDRISADLHVADLSAQISQNVANITSISSNYDTLAAAVTSAIQDIEKNTAAIAAASRSISDLEATVTHMPDSQVFLAAAITHEVITSDGTTSSVVDIAQDASVNEALLNLNSRIISLSADLDSATAGGINSITGINGVSVITPEGSANARQIGLNVSAEAGNLAQIKDNALYVSLTWEAL